MLVIQERLYIGGAEKKVTRLGLQQIWEQLDADLCGIGNIDIGLMVVPSDELAAYLTGRVARFTDARKAIERVRAADLLIAILALGQTFKLHVS